MRTTEGPFTLAPGPRRRRRWPGRVLLLVLLGVAVGGGWLGARTLFATVLPPVCEATAAGATFGLEPDQAANAALIAGVAQKRKLAPRAVTIALATALQESKLRNLRYGDRDSLGLFQQRPSQGWGTAAQILDPVYSTNKFFDALVRVKGYETMEITLVAQRVQRSGFPEAYAEHEALARVFASTLTGQSPGGLGCRLADATREQIAPGLAALPKDLKAQTGISVLTTSSGRSDPPSPDDGGVASATITVRTDAAGPSWALGSWAVARASLYGVTKVRVGDQEWTRSQADDGLSWAKSPADPVPTGQVVVVFDAG